MKMFEFLKLPGEVRNIIYENLIVQTPVFPWVNERPWVKHQQLHMNLAYTNMAIHHEYTSLFYSQTIFDFGQDDLEFGFECSDDNCELPRTAEFLERIGRNAKHIQHIHTQFPDYYYDKHKHEYYLFEHSSRIVNLFRSSCPNLKCLMLGPIYAYSESLRHLVFEDKGKAAMLLSLMDSHLRTIPSLTSIAIRIPDCELYINLVGEIESVRVAG
jgi:hypothetical protein